MNWSIKFQFTSRIGAGIGTERFYIKLELNKKELNFWYFCGAVKGILQTFGSIAVQAMVFNDKEN